MYITIYITTKIKDLTNWRFDMRYLVLNIQLDIAISNWETTRQLRDIQSSCVIRKQIIKNTPQCHKYNQEKQDVPGHIQPGISQIENWSHRQASPSCIILNLPNWMAGPTKRIYAANIKTRAAVVELSVRPSSVRRP